MIFALGIYGIIARRTLIGILISAELILNAANLNLLTLGRFGFISAGVSQVIVLFIIALAACETAIGLALAIAIYRIFKRSDLTQISELKG
jgi:NADH:ubiquinone oxidoreductase subunit K